MEDVVQPRSVKSWDVLRAWFEAASSAAVATADPGQEEGSKALLTGAEKVLKNGSGDGAEVTPATENGADASPTPTVAHTPTTEAELKKVYGVEVAGGSACEGGGGGERCRGLWKLSECKVALDGSCLKCGEVLRSIELSEDEEQRLLTQVITLVVFVVVSRLLVLNSRIVEHAKRCVDFGCVEGMCVFASRQVCLCCE